MLKILFTVGMIYVVWFVFKHWNRLMAARQAVMDEKKRPAARAARRDAPPVPQNTAQDLLPCPQCGAYVAAGSVCSCGKAA